jgi:hypothetical protein
MRRGAPLAALLALAGCGDDPPAIEEPASTGTTADLTTGTPAPPDPTTGAPPTTDAPATSTGDDPTTGAPTTGAPTTGDEPCPAPAPCDGCACVAGEWSCACPPLLPEAGFIDLEPVDYLLGEAPNEHARTSSPARIFYSFRPADPGVEGPLFVLFNGGPGASTGVLMALGTGPVVLTPDAVANPGTWTALGDLLYIDARGTGFSYLLADDPSVIDQRLAYFELANFNAYVDAGDFVRVLVRFLAAHPQLRAREVAIVGESYGGVRATAILALLLFYADYDAGGPGMLDDPAWVAEYEAFLADQDPEVTDWTPTRLAQQFSRLVLIQPALGGRQRTIAGAQFDAPGSPIHQLGDDLGLDFVPCSEKGPNCEPWANAIAFVEAAAGRSRYDLSQPVTWLDDIFAAIKSGLSDLARLEAVLGVAPAAVPGLPADQRGGAFRIKGQNTYPPDGGTVGELGALPPWDRYYLPFLSEANDLFRSPLADFIGVDPTHDHFGALFLRELAHVDVFLTAALRDVAIYAPSIPPALATYDELVAGVTVDPDAPVDAERPGEVRVEYLPGAHPDLPDPGVRRIRFPTYDASHSVAHDQPVALRDDLGAWLGE